jgi:transposase
MEIAMSRRTDAKLQALREARVLNARPQRVADPLFAEGEFFDPHDLVQVKYEMLRRVQSEGRPVSEAAATFGFSRVAFYQAQAAFADQGLPGLVRKRPGPRRAHKLSAVVVEYLAQQHGEDQSLRAKDLAEMVLKKFGLSVHPRSIERALAKRRKKGR